MGNLSKIKRENMLKFLSELREQYEDDSDIFTINDIELELTKNKYGLVWEEHQERVDIEIESKVPVFTQVSEKEITMDKNLPYNFLLEGDNLHSLYLLEKTHKNCIDVVLIDPPYNTGNKDFIYDDNYLNPEDDYKHSKWLSFMEKRLKIVYSLLKDSGMIIIHIDEKEFAQLKLLCDDIFGVSNYIGEFIWKARSGKGGTNSLIAMQHEYILCYAKNIANINFRQDINVIEKEKLENLRQWGQGVYRKDRPTMFFPILKKGEMFKLPQKEEYKRIYTNGVFNDTFIDNLKEKYESEGFDFILPYINDEYGRWRQGFDGVQKLIDNNQLVLTKDRQGRKTIKKIIPANKKSTVAIDSMLLEHGSASTGTKQIKELFDNKKVFDTTKPLEVEKFLIDLGVYNKPNAIILDCFAGSGTTGHAVVELNKKDGGNRQFILCTNNEKKICENITYERINKVITGYKYRGNKEHVLYERKLNLKDLSIIDSILREIQEIEDNNIDGFESIKREFKDNTIKLIAKQTIEEGIDGIPANLMYYKTDYINKLANDTEGIYVDELLKHIVEMVQLEHAVKIDNSNYAIILTDEDADRFERNKEELIKCKAIYISSKVLLTRNQRVMFDSLNIELIYIPEYYFDRELRDMGELCLC